MDAKVVCQEYSSSLEDLTFNSKPLINMLTMLAEENSQHAPEIIKLIEKRIYEVNELYFKPYDLIKWVFKLIVSWMLIMFNDFASFPAC